jgi:uncharacterized protein
MTTDIDPGRRARVAVVGAGVSGLTAAHALTQTHHVTLFEAQPRLGGHAHTHDVAVSGGRTVPVDSGFIVLNDRTYPTLRRLFDELGVPTRPTEMSMSITCAGCGLAYAGGRGARGIFAQPRRSVDARFWRLLLQVRRFQRRAKVLLTTVEAHPGGGHPDEALTYGDFLREQGFDAHFVAHYALPVVSCVWSMGEDEALAYPAAYLFAFLRHHGFLDLGDAPTWHTVVGGSRTYVEAITERLDVVRRGVPVVGVERTGSGVRVISGPGGETVEEFDQVVVATHADEALELLRDPTEREREVLGAFGYSTNDTYLHRDASVLPDPRVRASWNYGLEDCGHHVDRTRVSYWMNRLQGHDAADPLVVTLNPHKPPDEVIARMSYRHPVYTLASVAAQRGLPELNDGRIAFAGAYHGWGFHEDGCLAGLRAARSLGARHADDADDADDAVVGGGDREAVG